MDITGENLIAGAARAASPGDVDDACDKAAKAAADFAERSPEERASFLEAIADALEARKYPLVDQVMAETALPRPRVEGELGRTAGQLRLFAREVRMGDWLGVRIDHALPDRAPLPRPDLRLRHIPLGPVAVFGASNFPLAFSVAGGDTASALAAGCPVVVKAHPAHPGASEIAGRAIMDAVKKCALPEGCFSLVHGDEKTGAALVQHPAIKAVGFTGSRRGGLAIMKLAAARSEPIPVFAEMSSVNPVLIMPAALKARGSEIAKALAGSVTLGAGQFCTNPGTVFAIADDEEAYASFLKTLEGEIEAAEPATMLTESIAAAYDEGLARLSAESGVKKLAEGRSDGARRPAAIFETGIDAFAGNPGLQDEVFGAASLVIKCPSPETLGAAIAQMEGQLTITIQMDDEDAPAVRALLPVLERKAGRLLVNGMPTGVEVCDAMVHGGPFPATSDARTTSVGTLAITRFLRPVCYQNFPASLLPQSLEDANLLGLARRVDGARET